jgi:basic membrane protein A
MEMVRKAWAAVLAGVLAVSLVGCSGQNAGQAGGKGFSVGMVTDTGGLNDESFNQSAWSGIERSKKELSTDIKALESKRDEDYVPNLTKFAREGRNITWGIGFKFNKAIPEVANQFQNVHFGIVDDNLGGNIPKNVAKKKVPSLSGRLLV